MVRVKHRWLTVEFSAVPDARRLSSVTEGALSDSVRTAVRGSFGIFGLAEVDRMFKVALWHAPCGIAVFKVNLEHADKLRIALVLMNQLRTTAATDDMEIICRLIPVRPWVIGTSATLKQARVVARDALHRWLRLQHHGASAAHRPPLEAVESERRKRRVTETLPSPPRPLTQQQMTQVLLGVEAKINNMD